MIVKIFDGAFLKRLDNIKQWQDMDVFKEESVSQHSYKVSIFGRVLLEDIFGYNNDQKVLEFKLACLSAFLFHDWDEALLLRDMSHEVKYNTYNGTQIRKALDDFSHHMAVTEFTENNEDGLFSSACAMVIDNITHQDVVVKKFCKLCDWLALIFYMKRERELGNKSMDDRWTYCKDKFINTADDLESVLGFEFPSVKLNFSELNNLIESLYGKDDEGKH
jgi:5'-deoxynucleotidase YfbR-like HD superfamily hydrolase